MTLCVYHIPVCPFSQRVEILLELKGLRDAVSFRVVDITKPRDPHVLALSGGTTALPVLELEDGRSLKESLVLMAYFEDRFTAVPVRRVDPYERGIENLLVGMERGLVSAGYTLVMNQLPEKRQALVDAYLDVHAQLDAFLVRHGSVDGPFLFDRFGWAEAVFAPFFRRFAFVSYYEDVDLPARAALRPGARLARGLPRATRRRSRSPTRRSSRSTTTTHATRAMARSRLVAPCRRSCSSPAGEGARGPRATSTDQALRTSS
jgi:glutathione S-transferase